MANQESPSAIPTRSGDSRPAATLVSFPRASPAATNSGASSGGTTNSIGTNATWVGIV